MSQTTVKAATGSKKRQVKKESKEEAKGLAQDIIQLQREKLERVAKISKKSNRRIRYNKTNLHEIRESNDDDEYVESEEIEEVESGEASDFEESVQSIAPKPSKKARSKQSISSEAFSLLQNITNGFSLTYKEIMGHDKLSVSPLKHLTKEQIIYEIRKMKQKLSRTRSQKRVSRAKQSGQITETELNFSMTTEAIDLAIAEQPPISEYQMVASHLLETYSEQTVDVQQKLVEEIKKLLENDEKLYFAVLEHDINKIILKVCDIFRQNNYEQLLQSLKAVTPPVAVSTVVRLAECFPSLQKESSILSMILLPFLDNVTNFNFIRTNDDLQTARNFVTALIIHFTDTGDRVSYGFANFTIYLNPQLLIKVLPQTSKDILVKVFSENFTDEESRTMAEFPVKFLWKEVLQYLKKVTVFRNDLIDVISKLVITHNPCEFLDKLDKYVGRRYAFRAAFKVHKQIDLTIKELIELLDSIAESGSDVVVPLLQKNPKEWNKNIEQILSGLHSNKKQILDEEQCMKEFVNAVDTIMSEDDKKVYEKMQEISKEIEAKTIYVHNLYQCAMASAIIVSGKKGAYKFVSIPTGAGKTWIQALIAYYYITQQNKSVSIIEPNDFLYLQSTELLSELSHNLRVITIDHFYKYQDESSVVLVDEYDLMVRDRAWGFTINEKLTGFWKLQTANTIFFSATTSVTYERFVSQYLSPICCLKFKSEYEIIHGVSPTGAGTIKTCVDEVQLWDIFKDDLVKHSEQQPIVIFCNEKGKIQVEKILSQHQQLPVLYGATTENLRTIRAWKVGVLVLGPHEAVGVNCKFQDDSIVLITSKITNYPEYLQMIGRSSRTRGLCQSIYYVVSKSTAREIENAMKTSTASDFAEYEQFIRYIHNKADYHRLQQTLHDIVESGETIRSIDALKKIDPKLKIQR